MNINQYFPEWISLWTGESHENGFVAYPTHKLGTVIAITMA